MALPRSGRSRCWPFRDLSGNPDEEYFADGVSDALTADVAKIRSLNVISRTSALQFKNSGKRVPEIARELHVDAVVEGSIARTGDRVQVRVQLIHGPTDRHLWTETYDRNVRDILMVQNEVAVAIARQIQIRLSPEENSRLTGARAVNQGAFEAYLRARYYWNQRTEEEISKAINWLRAAIHQDPAWAAPYAGLADCYNQLGTLGVGARSPREMRPLALAAAQKALEINPDLAEAHAALGFARMYDWDWAGANRGFQRSIDINPSYAPARTWYASFLAFTGQLSDAVVQVSRAHELDPLSEIVQTQVGWILKFADRDDEAIRHYARALDMNPKFHWAVWQLGQSYIHLGRYNEAVTLLENNIRVSGRHPAILGILGEAYARAGRRAEAVELLRELDGLSTKRYVSPLAAASIYLGLGETERFFECMETAYQERANGLAAIKVWPSRRAYPAIRSDPRFQAFVRRVGL